MQIEPKVFLHQQKKRTFLSSVQSLSDSFEYIQPHKIMSLGSLLSDYKLNEKLTTFCQKTYVLSNPQQIKFINNEQNYKSFQHLVDQNVQNLLSMQKSNYVQCLGHQYKDYTFKLKSFNFGKTILEQSLISELYQYVSSQIIYNILCNYAIFMEYKDQYVQVTGKPLTEQFNMKILGDKKKIKNKVGTSLNNKKTFTYNYSEEIIHRFQMFYCSHTNRNSGLFRQNIFFDKGIIKSQFIHEVQHLVNKYVDTNLLNKKVFKENQLSEFKKHFICLFNVVRNLFNRRIYKNKRTSLFDCQLSKLCSLPLEYKLIKKQIMLYIEKGQGSSEELFQKAYHYSTQYSDVHRLLKSLIHQVVPVQLLGIKNLNIFKRMLLHFIKMKRFQNYRIQDFLYEMNVFQIPWVKLKFHNKYKGKIIGRGRNILAIIISFLLNKLIIPVLKYNFYITEKHKQANKIFYYRKPLWILISQLSLTKFSQDNLHPITTKLYAEIKAKSISYPEGKLRILPKKGTFRPIITFNRKMKIQNSIDDNSFKGKATLNQILGDTQLVLRNLKNILGKNMGYCIFDNQQISNLYDKFVRKWRQGGCQSLSYFTLDIKKCYDSIDTNKLVKIIQETEFIQDFYLITKYNRIYRNKKPLNECNKFPVYYNFKERINATSLYSDPMQIKQVYKIPAINIYPAKHRTITREQIINKLKQLCQGSIIRYKNQYWLQKFGIPQGLNVSGVLCSLYFAKLEKDYLKVQDGLLMRLTDDYLYIGPQTQAKKVLDSLLKCARQNSFSFNADKITKNFYHPQLSQISNNHKILWIGKIIDIKTLEMYPYSQMNDRLSYAMNVNLNRKYLKSFLKNKLKSLLTNHFASYFKPKLFNFQSLSTTIRLYVSISMQKYFPFLSEVRKLKLNDTCAFVTKILQVTIHQFLIYACMLAENKDKQQFYNHLFIVVAEQLVSFMRKKRSFLQFRPIEKIFNKRAIKYKKILKKGLETIQTE